MSDTKELLNEKTSSVTLKKDSKGNYNWDLKIYFSDENEDKVLERLESLDNKIKEKFKND